MQHDPYAALRIRDFRRLLVGQFVATLGDQMIGVALGWQLYEQTHSAFALGLVGLVEIIPVMLLALPAGLLSDRMNRKHIVVVMRFVLALCYLGLALLTTTHSPVALLYGCIFAIGVARALYGPASSTLIPLTIPEDQFAGAVTWSSNAWQLAAAAGPALGGFVIAISRSATPVYLFGMVGALIYVLSVGAIYGLPVAPRSSVPDRKAEGLEGLADGIRFLKRSPVLLATITLDLFAVLLGGATALLPVYAKDILAVGPVGLGWLRAAPSIGAVLMALFLAHRPPFRHAGTTLLWAVAGFGAATIVFGVSRSFPLSLAMLFLLGALDNISVVIRSSLLLLRAPDEMRGRVSAVNNVFVGASNELGAFESGAVAALAGPIFAVVSGGIGTILVVLLTGLFVPQLRALGSLHSSPPEEDVSAPGVPV